MQECGSCVKFWNVSVQKILLNPDIYAENARSPNKSVSVVRSKVKQKQSSQNEEYYYPADSRWESDFYSNSAETETQITWKKSSRSLCAHDAAVSDADTSPLRCGLLPLPPVWGRRGPVRLTVLMYHFSPASAKYESMVAACEPVTPLGVAPAFTVVGK